MSLDPLTLFVATMAVGLMFALTLSIYYPSVKRYAGFGSWAFAQWLFVLGIACLIVRGAVPDWLSVVVGNALLLLGTFYVYRGVRQFRERSVRYWPLACIVVTLALLCWWTYGQPNLTLRAVATSSFFALVFGATTLDLVRKLTPPLRRSLLLAATVLGAMALGQLLRVVDLLLVNSIDALFEPTMGQQAMFMLAAISMAGWPAAVLLIIAQLQHWELEQANRTDGLTGLGNRRQAFEVATQEMARARRHDRDLAVVMLDLDHFKRVNDEHGHLVGDEVLSRFGKLLSENSRPQDVAARVGGEEFLLVLPETDVQAATRLVERLRERAGNDEVCLVSFSAGVTALQPTDTNLDDVLRRADRAMYRAKEAGRDRVETAVPNNMSQAQPA